VEAALNRIPGPDRGAVILTADQSLAKRYLELGATFVAIGSDVGVLANATAKLLADFHKATAAAPGQSTDAKVY